MKITLKTDKGDRDIDMKPTKGKHVKKLWSHLIKVQKDESNISAFEGYLSFLDTLVCELTGLTVDELDELPMDEKQKLIDIPVNKAINMINFTPLSHKQPNLSVRATQK